jgi:FAD/FMN-containing dehydrogenase
MLQETVQPEPVSAPPTSSDNFVGALNALLGVENVLSDLPSRVFYSTDIFTPGVVAELVIQPRSAEQLAAAVALCTEAGRVVIPRGGGFSYTSGYIPVAENSVIVDIRALNRILEINPQDSYMVVECGATWKQVYEAATSQGCRCPYFGPMSGYHSTVGGALSQGSFFLGSTQYGTTADTVLGLKVVLADGSIVQTGSGAATEYATPFFRNYGPDLTGLFLHDSGALGFKTEAVLKLIPKPEHARYATYAVEDGAVGLGIMAEIARRGLAAECYMWDPVMAKTARDRATLREGIKSVSEAARSGSTLLGGLKDAAKMALAGRGVFDGDAYLLHVAIDDVTALCADEKMRLVQEMTRPFDLRSVEPTLPRVVHSTPFTDFLEFEAASPSRRLPTHALFSHSNVAKAHAEMSAYLDTRKDELGQLGITWGSICFAVGANAICIEPLIYWTDPQLALNDRARNLTDIDGLAENGEVPAARLAVKELRANLVAIFTRHGGVHMQIGKDYPYRQTRKPNTFALLENIKAILDPAGLVNPGALGLARAPIPSPQ